jgi:hypothetical protein
MMLKIDPSPHPIESRGDDVLICCAFNIYYITSLPRCQRERKILEENNPLRR